MKRVVYLEGLISRRRRAVEEVVEGVDVVEGEGEGARLWL